MREGMMMEEKDKKRADICFCVAWAVYILWRFFVYLSYNVHYTDDDQALMWYGTALFAHGSFPEPCFFGQDYGTMLESLLAVPLYYAGWPLHYALPLVTLLLSLSAFLAVSLYFWRNKEKDKAWICLLILVFCGWRVDVLQTVPRSLISGYPFALIGIMLLSDRKASGWKSFLGAFLSGLGAAFNLTALSLIGIFILWFVLNRKREIKKLLWMLPGYAFAFAYQLACLLFYRKNQDFYVYGYGKISLAWEHFAGNFPHLGRLLNELWLVEDCGMFLLPLLGGFVLFLLWKKKDYRTFALLLAAIIGSISLLFTDKSGDYMQGSLLYGQLRLFLFLPYLLVCVLLLAEEEQNETRPQNRGGVFLSLCCAAVIVKGLAFGAALQDEKGVLYRDSELDEAALVVGVGAVDELLAQAELIDQLAKEGGVSFVSISNEVDYVPETGEVRLPNKSIAYIGEALYFDSPYEFFLPVFDRRTALYQKVSKEKGGKMLLLRYPVEKAEDIRVVDLGAYSPTEWFAEYCGLYRDHILQEALVQ